MNKIVSIVCLLCFAFLNPVAAASRPVTLYGLAGSWTVTSKSTLSVKRLPPPLRMQGTASCTFVPRSALNGDFVCVDGNGQPVVNGTLTLSKNGKKLLTALGAETLEGLEAGVRSFILAKNSSQDLGIDESTLTVDIKKIAYTPIKVKSASSVGAQRITLTGTARALVEGKRERTGFTSVIDLRFKRQ